MKELKDIHIYSVPNFKKYKSNLIKLLDNTKTNSLITDKEKISKTDFNLKLQDKKYVNYFLNNISKNFLKDLSIKLNISKFRISKIWYQTYKRGDFHDWHVHPDCHFTNVFFINLPSLKLKTQIMDINKYIIKTNIKEGDIITFPAYLNHRSIKNIFKKDKIIMSFNLDILEHS